MNELQLPPMMFGEKPLIVSFPQSNKRIYQRYLSVLS